MTEMRNRLMQALTNDMTHIPALTAGNPSLTETKRQLLELAAEGVKAVQLVLPFSDPVAADPREQERNLKALAAGYTTDGLFAMLKEVRKEADLALVLITYANPVFIYGIDRFFTRCEETGVGGILMQDVPLEEEREFTPAAEAHGVAVIRIACSMNEKRLAKIVDGAEGFIYLASRPEAGKTNPLREKAASMTALPLIYLP